MLTDSVGVLIAPEDGTALRNPLGGSMTLKVTDAMTAGSYSVHDNVIPAGSPGPLPHLHRHHEVVFFVLNGELTVRVGARTVTAAPGSFVLIPRGTVHQPASPMDQDVHMLLMFSSGGMDAFFLAASHDPDVQARLREFTARYGYEFADLPSKG